LVFREPGCMYPGSFPGGAECYLATESGVTVVGVFGSYVRGEQYPNGDMGQEFRTFSLAASYSS